MTAMTLKDSLRELQERSEQQQREIRADFRLTQATRQGCRSRMAAALLMLGLWFGLSALVISPELHRLVHKDARASSHNCLVTQLHRHSVSPGFAPILTPDLTDRWIIQPTAPELQVQVSSDHRLSPSRAPPAV